MRKLLLKKIGFLVTVKTFIIFVNCINIESSIKTGNGLAKIIGGRNSVANRYPWMVSLRIQDMTGKLHHICGGSLISNKWVLTAAHCVDSGPFLFVSAGKQSLKSEEKTEQTKMMQSVYIHRDYIKITSTNPPYNDIALIELREPFELTKFISTIALPDSEKKYDGKNATITGWGVYDPNNMKLGSDILKTANVPIIQYERCVNIYSRYQMDKNFICAGPPNGSASCCKGDSGGPLFIKQSDKYEIIGVTSFTRMPCGNKVAPTVFTKVSGFIPWIQQVMEG